MKRLSGLVSLIMICAFTASLCSCANNNQQPTTPTTTVTETTETTPEETTEPTPTPTPEPTPEPTPMPEPTSTPTPTPKPVAKNFSTVFSMMASTMGKSVDQAKAIVEKYTGVSLGDAQVYERNNNFSVDLTVEGVHFDSLSIMTGTGKNKDKVVFIGMNNSTDDKSKLQSYYTKYSKLLKKKYKKPTSTSKNKNTKFSLYKINKKYETNCGWYFNGNTKSFWINYYLKSANK